MGYLDPSEIPSGRMFRIEGNGITVLPEVLQRPVHTTVYNFNRDGTSEVVVCENGDLNGGLAMFKGIDWRIRKRYCLIDPVP